MIATIIKQVRMGFWNWAGVTLTGKIVLPKMRKPLRVSGFAPGEQKALLDRLVLRRRKELLGT